MIVVFRRVGERRYEVEAQRSLFPDLKMSPAPGYDRFLPHDLMHMVVEAQLGLTHALFGQLAAGGDAGTFQPIIEAKGSRETTRVRNRVKARGKKLMREGRDECSQSERATYICWQEWMSRSGASDRRKLSQSMAQQAKEVQNVASANELRKLDQRKLAEICEHLDELSLHWSSLEVGQSMAVRWPDLAILKNATQSR